MLYLGIDQHANQLTIDLGTENGDLVLHRQVKTEWKPLRKFLGELESLARKEGGYMAIVEVCGFNDYLMDLLKEYGCDQVVLVQPDGRKKCKTDRRDARTLRESLWINRARLREGKRPAKLRVVRVASEDDAMDRQLTTLRSQLTTQRTRLINRVKTILRKRNLQHDCPTKGIQTKKARKWLWALTLPEMDRFEMNVLLREWDLIDEQLDQVDKKIQERYRQSDVASVVGTIPGMGYFNGLSIACRIGDVEDFPRGGSLANYWGLTPGARNSGEKNTPLGITKAGSSHARYVLGQVVVHVLRRDRWMRQWYQKIKRRRGSKIGRVAVMRRLATIICSMVKYDMPYMTGGPEKFEEYLRKHKGFFGETHITAGRV